MARPRKTINVSELKDATNRALQADSRSAEWRAGAAATVEQALYMANAYRGFHYTGPGERDPESGCLIPGTYDDTRRWYH